MYRWGMPVKDVCPCRVYVWEGSSVEVTCPSQPSLHLSVIMG